jgi:hypothetical protein
VKRSCVSESITNPAGNPPSAIEVTTDRFDPVTVTVSPPDVVALDWMSQLVITGGALGSATFPPRWYGERAVNPLKR